MIDFRAFCESPSYCGLELSPLIAAIADASDGITPTTINDDIAFAHFGCPLADLPKGPPRTVGVRAGGRGGKSSRLLAPKALHAAWTVPLPTLRRGESAMSLLCAPDMKLGRQLFSFVVGYVEGSKILSRALVVEPTKDALELKRPDGKVVRVEVLAATRGGRGLRGRTLVFAGLDEACFFFDEATGVVNDADVFRAVLQRVAPGGQVWIASTPWIADVGLLETTLAKNWGTHTNALVCTAATRALNPSWDPSGEIERDLREQDPDAAAREIDGTPLTGGAGTFFDAGAIRDCVDEEREMELPPHAGSPTTFGADLAFVRDSSALVGVAGPIDDLAGPVGGGLYDVLVIEEKRPSKGKPLRPREVVDAFAETMKRYGSRRVTADGHYRASAVEHLEPHGIRFEDAPAGNEGKADVYMKARELIHDGRVRLPNHPRLLAQLRAVVSKPMPGGGIQISSPRRGGGGHGDIVSALVLALWEASRGSTGGYYGPLPGVFHMNSPLSGW